MNLKEVDKNSREYQVWRQEQYIKEISAEDPKIKKSIEYYESDGMKLSIQMALPNKEKYPRIGCGRDGNFFQNVPDYPILS